MEIDHTHVGGYFGLIIAALIRTFYVPESKIYSLGVGENNRAPWIELELPRSEEVYVCLGAIKFSYNRDSN